MFGIVLGTFIALVGIILFITSIHNRDEEWSTMIAAISGCLIFFGIAMICL